VDVRHDSKHCKLILTTYYLDDFNGVELKTMEEFSSDGAVENEREPLKDFIVCAECFIIFFRNQMTLHH